MSLLASSLSSTYIARYGGSGRNRGVSGNAVLCQYLTCFCALGSILAGDQIPCISCLSIQGLIDSKPNLPPRRSRSVPTSEPSPSGTLREPLGRPHLRSAQLPARNDSVTSSLWERLVRRIVTARGLTPVPGCPALRCRRCPSTMPHHRSPHPSTARGRAAGASCRPPTCAWWKLGPTLGVSRQHPTETPISISGDQYCRYHYVAQVCLVQTATGRSGRVEQGKLN